MFVPVDAKSISEPIFVAARGGGTTERSVAEMKKLLETLFLDRPT